MPVATNKTVPIRYFSMGRQFDPDTERLMGVVLESARVALDVVDRDDLINNLLAEKIMALPRDSERICDRVLADLRQPAPSA